MRCPYCYKTVRDMPTHLQSSEKCKNKHSIRLGNNFKQWLGDTISNPRPEEVEG